MFKRDFFIVWSSHVMPQDFLHQQSHGKDRWMMNDNNIEWQLTLNKSNLCTCVLWIHTCFVNMCSVDDITWHQIYPVKATRKKNFVLYS